MGLKVLHLGQITDLSGSKYEPQNLGRIRLNIRTSSGDTGVKKYGLATSVEQASDARLRFNISGSQYYIATSATSTRQSNYTSYSSYYTSTYTQTSTESYTNSDTYTQGYPKNSVLTRQGTQTTATRTQKAIYTYGASYYNGVASYYTAYSTLKNVYQTAYLTGTLQTSYQGVKVTTRASAYTQYWSRLHTQSWLDQTLSRALVNSNLVFKHKNSYYNPNLKDVYSSSFYQEEYQKTSWTYSYTVSYDNKRTSRTFRTISTATHTLRRKTNTSATLTGVGNYTKYQERYYKTKANTAVTATRSSQYSSYYTYTAAANYKVVQPNYVAVGATTSNQGGYATWTVASANYTYGTSSLTYLEGLNETLSYRRVSQYRTTGGAASTTVRTGSATLTSTTTPITGVPANYVLSSGPKVIGELASFTYTDAGCTKTYASNYSTSYWTVTSTLTRTNTLTRTKTNTLNSSPYYKSSLGQTATTRTSAYTKHNFI